MLKKYQVGIFFIVSSFIFSMDAHSGQSSSKERKIDVHVQLRNHREAVTKAECLVEASVDVVWQVVRDEIDEWSQFVPNVLFSRIVSEEKAQVLISQNPPSFEQVQNIIGNENLPLSQRLYRKGTNTYYYKLLHLNLPWPVANRWLLQQETDSTPSDKKGFYRQYWLVAGNVVKGEGTLRAQPLETNPQFSKLTYTNIADAGFQMPGFIAKFGSTKATRDMLQALRKRAEALEND